MRSLGIAAVYFIQAGEGGPVKIGCAKSPSKRLIELQHGHYLTLHLLRSLAGTKAVESQAHSFFIEKHIRGEWFEFDSAMMTWQPGDGLRKPGEFYQRFHGAEKARIIAEKGATTRRAWQNPELWRTA